MLSRKIRKQEKAKVIFNRGKNALSVGFCGVVLALAWTSGDIQTFTALTAILFGGALLSNPFGIRGYLPGLDSTTLLAQTLTPLLYLVIVLTLIGITGN